MRLKFVQSMCLYYRIFIEPLGHLSESCCFVDCVVGEEVVEDWLSHLTEPSGTHCFRLSSNCKLSGHLSSLTSSFGDPTSKQM